MFSDISECTVAVVAKKAITGTLKATRTTLHVNAAKLARRAGTKAWKIAESEVHIIRDQKVQESITVVITKSSSSRPPPICDSRCFGNVRECAIAIVAIQDVSAKTGHIDIWPAVIVVISYGATHRKAGITDAGLIGNIGKCSIPIVTVEHAAGSLTFESHVDRRRIGKVNVLPPIAIIINKQHSATH